MGLCLLPRYEISKDFGAIVKKKKGKRFLSLEGREHYLTLGKLRADKTCFSITIGNCCRKH